MSGFPKHEDTYPHPSPPGASREQMLLNALHHSGYMPAFSADSAGNLTLSCREFGDTKGEDQEHIIRVPREEVTDTTLCTMLEELVQKLGVPEKWII
jgi:hypothetical protein